MDLKIVHAEPTTRGALHHATEGCPRSLPFLPTGRDRAERSTKLKDLAHRLDLLAAVETVTVFDAIALAPPRTYVEERKDGAWEEQATYQDPAAQQHGSA